MQAEGETSNCNCLRSTAAATAATAGSVKTDSQSVKPVLLRSGRADAPNLAR